MAYQCRGMTWNVNIYFMFPLHNLARKGLIKFILLFTGSYMPKYPVQNIIRRAFTVQPGIPCANYLDRWSSVLLFFSYAPLCCYSGPIVVIKLWSIQPQLYFKSLFIIQHHKQIHDTRFLRNMAVFFQTDTKVHPATDETCNGQCVKQIPEVLLASVMNIHNFTNQYGYP